MGKYSGDNLWNAEEIDIFDSEIDQKSGLGE